MTQGEEMLELALAHVGDEYFNIRVPKNNANWKGPWDCAELMSWLVYQVGGELYGCVDNNGDPATVEAYTGAWQRDVGTLGRRISVAEAAATVGGIVLRYPPVPGSMGHIAICDGEGGTVEAAGKRYGVCKGRVTGREWHAGVLIPGFTYPGRGEAVALKPPATLYGYDKPDMKVAVIRSIQQALKENGIDPGPINGQFTELTLTAVQAFQAMKGLVVDGVVGQKTARALKIKLA